MTHTDRDRCASGHALALAVWEKNHSAWLEGGFFELRSKKEWLQKVVGDGGTLWIAVSRPIDGGRIYTLSFRLRHCRKRTYPIAGEFGKYAVIGDPDRSSFFASDDATLLLLALRFEPYNPISGPSPSQISNKIRNARCLSAADIRLLEEYSSRLDRWSVFISYRRTTEGHIAADLYDALQRAGVSVFRDQEDLRGGDLWWPTVKRAIARTQRFVVLIGPDTHESEWVREEIRHAFDNNVIVIPVLLGGKLRDWGDLEEQLSSRHMIDCPRDQASSLVEKLLAR